MDRISTDVNILPPVLLNANDPLPKGHPGLAGVLHVRIICLTKNKDGLKMWLTVPNRSKSYFWITFEIIFIFTIVVITLLPPTSNISNNTEAAKFMILGPL